MVRTRKKLCFLFLTMLGFACCFGQSSTIGIRLGKLGISQSEQTQLEGAPIVFSNWAASSYQNRHRNFSIGGYYEFDRRATIYKRFILQYEEDHSNDGRTWNLAHNETAVLALHAFSPKLTAAFSMGRFWQMNRLRLAFGLEVGFGYSPGYEQSELYYFYDSLGLNEGAFHFQTSIPESYQPYLKWFGSGYYRFSKRFALGIELAYGLEGYITKGSRTVIQENLDPNGLVISTNATSTRIDHRIVEFPASISLPFLGLSYQLGNRNP